MPTWALRFLPHGLTVLAIIGAIWWIDSRGYDRAMADRDKRDREMLAQMRSQQRQSEQRLAVAIGALGQLYQAQQAGIASARQSLQPIIIGEIARESRLSNPAAGLTPGLLDAVNRARATGPCAASAAGRIVCAMPPLAPIADPSIAALAQGDVDAAFTYADCAARHAGAVNAYQAAREEALRWTGDRR